MGSIDQRCDLLRLAVLSSPQVLLSSLLEFSQFCGLTACSRYKFLQTPACG